MIRRSVLLLMGAALLGVISFGYYMLHYAELDLYVPMFAEHCAECHGEDLDGTDRGIALVDNYLSGGDTVAGLAQSIRHGRPELGMPPFNSTLTEDEIKGLAIYVAERRLGQRFTDFRFDWDLVVPEDPVVTEEHNFLIETVADNLAPLTFSIAPLPDGSFLLTEKERGLSIVSPDGEQSTIIEGTPKLGSEAVSVRGVHAGVGWLLDVAPHPDYVNNGWIYLHYTDLCSSACELTNRVFPSSMNRLDRGRIRNGNWMDVETIWQAEPKHYSTMADTAAGGRIAFDNAGHVFISIGMKEIMSLGAQDLNSPFGKIHRINDDGTIPADNPFVISSQGLAVTSENLPFIRQSIWTYGHRSPQGLEWNSNRGKIWNSEMGPRGGDEINELVPARNYGWPYHSLGLEYVGRKVERHAIDDIEFDAEDVEMTLVDFTPSPAVSSFVFYQGDKFPKWQDNLLLGSLKGSSLFRLVFDGNRLIHKETLFKDLARVRDIEIGYDGLVYLLLENHAGSSIVRLVPSTQGSSD